MDKKPEGRVENEGEKSENGNLALSQNFNLLKVLSDEIKMVQMKRQKAEKELEQKKILIKSVENGMNKEAEKVFIMRQDLRSVKEKIIVLRKEVSSKEIVRDEMVKDYFNLTSKVENICEKRKKKNTEMKTKFEKHNQFQEDFKKFK